MRQRQCLGIRSKVEVSCLRRSAPEPYLHSPESSQSAAGMAHGPAQQHAQHNAHLGQLTFPVRLFKHKSKPDESVV